MELRIDGLKKTYGSVKALKGISYSFTPGVYGILGANGAGKSTIAKKLAKELDYIYVDTGAMYRAMALYMICLLYTSDAADE